MARQKQYRQSHSSGLEVVWDYSGLQVVPEPTLEVRSDDERQAAGYYAPTQHSHDLVCSSITHSDKMTATETEIVLTEGTLEAHRMNAITSKQQSGRRLYIIIGAVIIVTLIVAAVLGGVLGSRKWSSESSSSTSSQQSPTSTQSSHTSTTSTPPSSTELMTTTAVAPYSRLGAAAWYAEGGFTRLLFYQDSNGTLRYSLAAGSGNVDQSSWDEPKPISPQFSVANITGITTSILSQREETPTVQLEIFYLNKSSVINAMNYARAPGFKVDSINEKKFQAMEGSDLAAYWPFTLYQSLEGMLQLIRFPWRSFDLKVRAKRGSRLALIPTSRNFTKVESLGRWAIIYQTENGKLVAWEDPAGQGADETYSGKSEGTLWNSSRYLSSHLGLWSDVKHLCSWLTPSDAAFPDITSSDNILSIAAFSVAASNEVSEDIVNTYLLYQDNSGIIQQIWRDGVENSWHTSTPDAFNGADKRGGVACVTTPMWLSQPVLGERLLETASDLTQCFFIKAGSVMEVQLDGTGWKPPREIMMDRFT